MERCIRNLGVLLVLAGCAEPTTGSTSGKGKYGGAAGAAAGTGSGAAGSGSGGDGFGNGTGNQNLLPTTSADAGACELGMFCPPPTPDPNNCGSETIEGDTKVVTTPGNVLIIFDRSGSMADAWGNSTRWQAAGGAMVAALMPQQDLLTIGAVFFPSDQNLLSCVVEPITAPTQMQFLPGPMALQKLQTGGANGLPMYSPGLGFTPTLEGLQSADAAFAGAMLTGTTVAILITDGDPNCTWNQGTAVGIVSAWAAKGIKTYVLGVPGVGGQGVATLNAVAVAGGTMQYIDAADPMTLQMKIQDIVLQTVAVGIESCTITLDQPAAVPEKLHVVVTQNGMEQDLPRTFPSGEEAWTISADGAVVELLGNTCAAAKDGFYSSVQFQFGCVEIPPAPPPPPPD